MIVFEDKDKANEVAAAVHKQIDGPEPAKQESAHVEVQETKREV